MLWKLVTEKSLIPLQLNVDIRAEVTHGKHMFPTDTPVPDIPWVKGLNLRK